jgi:hypothetical protein
MPYIGTSPSNGVRRVFTYTATASQTTFSGASNEGSTLAYVDNNYEWLVRAYELERVRRFRDEPFYI